MLHKLWFDIVWNPSGVLWTLPVYAKATFDPIQPSCSPVPEGTTASSFKIILCLYDERVGGKVLWYMCKMFVHIFSLCFSVSVSVSVPLPSFSLHVQALNATVCAWRFQNNLELSVFTFSLFVISSVCCSLLPVPIPDCLALQSFISPTETQGSQVGYWALLYFGFWNLPQIFKFSWQMISWPTQAIPLMG